MQKNSDQNQFVTIHYVDDAYHREHPQLVHRHADVLELLYIMEGGGNYTVGGREYYVQPGNLVICNAGVFHGELPGQTKSMVSYCCVMDGIRHEKLPHNTLTGKTESPILYFSEERQELEAIYYALLDLYDRGTAYRAVCADLAKAIFDMVLIRLGRRSELNEETHQRKNELIQMVSEYMDLHFTEEITLEHLEREFHINRFSLSRIFKEETGLSPIKYVMMRRIGEAQNLLMNTTQLIGDIGETLGFHDNSHFSNTFRKYTGITPGAYRKHFQE